MPRRIPIRTKLAAALAVPIFALLLVSALEVRQSAESDRETRSQTGLATASIGPGGVITTLQNERNYGSVWLLGFEGTLQLPVTSFEEAVAASDDAIETFRADLEDKPEIVQRTYAPALDHIQSELDALRQTVFTYTGPRDLSTQPVSDPFFSSYTTLIDELFQANGQAALAIDDPTLRRGVELTDLASHQIENVARLTRVLLLAGVSGGLNASTDVAAAAGLLGQVDTGVSQVRELGTGRYQPAAAKVDQEFAASGYTDLVRGAIESGQVPIPEIMASLSREDDEGYNGFRTRVNTEISERADDLNAESAATRLRYLTLGGLALVVAGLVTWLVSRSITRPLRSLTQQAKSMAEDRLPAAVTDILETPLGEDVTVPTVDPVVVHTRDEVSDVADALNTVQDSALDLAVEQAVLRRNIADSFVNLGRRNQNLLGRQLDFITELESNETNADTLSNLFRLDHLATRMRRNAESLLVLAGIEPPRQWAAPVRLTDVIRAALGEVESYQRVAVRGVEPATIVGSAAADLAHLLAELIENALVFSPPDRSVDIRGRHREDGGYTLAVIDIGLGMAASDVAAANRRLAGAESFTVAPSKYLGHYVAGNLAARHDIEVRLDTSPGQGITATATLPPTLLTTERVTSAPVTPPHGQRAVRAPLAPAAALPPAPAELSPPYDAFVAPAPWEPPPPAPPVPATEAPYAPTYPPLPSTPIPMPPAPTPMPPGPGPVAAPVPDGVPPFVPAARAAPPVPPAPGGPLPDGRPRGLWPRQPTHPGGPRIVGGPRPTASEVTGQLPLTAGGLARRAPTTPRPPAARVDDQTLLQALGHYVPRSPSGAPAPPAVPITPPGERGASPLTPPDALTRRVPGAQLPQSDVISLRGGGPLARPRPAAGASKATDVQALLSSFTAGVQRGLEEARQRAERATADAGPNGRGAGS